jgi:hypothetical protein
VSLEPTLIPMRPPVLRTSGVGLETQLQQSVQDDVNDLARWSEAFVAASALRRVCENQMLAPKDEAEIRWSDDLAAFYPANLWSQWSSMAVRSAGMAARNFGKALHKIVRNVESVPDWRGGVDRGSLKESSALFSANFSQIDRVRHSFAHPEYYSMPSKKMAAEIKADDERFGLFNLTPGATITMAAQTLMVGDNVYVTIDGDVATFELSEASASVLIAITNTVYNALEGIAR